MGLRVRLGMDKEDSHFDLIEQKHSGQKPEFCIGLKANCIGYNSDTSWQSLGNIWQALYPLCATDTGFSFEDNRSMPILKLE